MMELEAEVAKLKELNEELQKKQVYSCAISISIFVHVNLELFFL